MAETIPLKIKMKDGFTVKMKFACQVTISWMAFDLLSVFPQRDTCAYLNRSSLTI